MERMLLPFEYLTWVWILITFGIALVVIQIVNVLSDEVKDFVFGRKVRSPRLNLLISIMGGCQKVLPKRNFGRYLLMLFLLWSLIFRSCYQGKLYKFLQSEGRKPEVKTFEELIEKDFVIHEMMRYSFEVGTTDQIGR